MIDLDHLANLRRDLAENQVALSDAKRALERAKALAEQRAIDAAGGEKALGANAEARERALALAFITDQEYQAHVESVAQADTWVGRIQTDIEIVGDQRRADEWAIRDRLVQALERSSIPTNHHGADARVFDDVADEVTDRRALLRANPVSNTHATTEPDDELIELPF